MLQGKLTDYMLLRYCTFLLYDKPALFPKTLCIHLHNRIVGPVLSKMSSDVQVVLFTVSQCNIRLFLVDYKAVGR